MNNRDAVVTLLESSTSESSATTPETKESIFLGAGIGWGTTTSQPTPETRGFWSPVSSECREGGGVASIAGDWWRRGRQLLVFWSRSMAIRVELEVGDEGEDDDRRFPVLLVSSVVVRCGGRRWRVGAWWSEC